MSDIRRTANEFIAMEKLWKGRFSKPLDEKCAKFNSSLPVDKRLYECDIKGSVAHVTMLKNCNIIPSDDADKIVAELKKIKDDIDSGALKFDPECEDVHSFIENELTARIGDAGKKLHTARSRNDQVALDTRLYLSDMADKTTTALKGLIEIIVAKAEENTNTVMPGYTHMQIAQPITLANHLLSYAFMFLRDCDRIGDCKKRTEKSPLGSCALAGTTYPVDREMTAKLLGFSGITQNSLDGVSDRDFVLEFAFCCSTIMMHLSRFSEEIILWCSKEFSFIELDDAFSTGSSIMPQKKNPDMAELIRGKTGRVYGNLMALLTVMKGLPLAYNKDMQEDKELIFDSIDTAIDCIDIFGGMLDTATFKKQNMLKAAKLGFINATDCADYLTKKGVPFRMAYNITGKLVAYCLEKGKALDELTLDELKPFSDVFDKDVYDKIELSYCVAERKSDGGPAPSSVKKQIAAVKECLKSL